MSKERKQTEAVFSFIEYHFTHASIDFTLMEEVENCSVIFTPEGIYDSETGRYEVHINFIAKAKESSKTLLDVDCRALFGFRERHSIDELPEFFFANSIAIIYPYLRAFVSTLTLQANYAPFVLPTYNVSALGVELKESTRSGSITKQEY